MRRGRGERAGRPAPGLDPAVSCSVEEVELWAARIPELRAVERQAERAEQDGWTGITFTDSQNLNPDPFVAVALAGRATERLRFATGVTNLFTRHPALLAGTATMVQEETGGRFVLGVGRGDTALSHLGRTPMPVAEFEPRLRDVQTYLSGGEVDCDGFASSLRWLDQAQQPKVPLDVACSGPRLITLAAQVADRLTLAVGAEPDRIRWAIDLAGKAAAEAGRDPAEIGFGVYVNVACLPEAGAARAAIAGGVAAFAHFSATPGSTGAGLSDDDRSVIQEVGRRYDTTQHFRNDADHNAALDAGLRRQLRHRRSARALHRAPAPARSRRHRTGGHDRRRLHRRPRGGRAVGPAAGDRGPAHLPRGRPPMTHDLIIRGGTVVDGTGSPGRTADVAVSDGVVTEVGRVDGAAERELDADGLLVTPGFVDIHAHYDGQATWDDRLTPSSWHGVTTVVAGNCGVGFAPVEPADQQRLIELMEGVEDIPGAALHVGLDWNWRSFPDFLDAVDGKAFDMDVALQLPHGALRLNVMGERGAQREPATPEDISAMAIQAKAAVRAGALGFTTSRTLNHRTSKGEPTPTLTASADELVGIACALGETGLGVLQVVSDFADVEAEFGLFRAMAEQSGRPLSFSLVQSPADTWRQQLDLLAAANADGVAMTAQVAPRAVGLLLGLQCTLNPLMTNPAYREVARLPLAERVATMSDPAFKTRVLDAATAARATQLGGRLILSLHRMFPLSDPPDYEPDPASSVAAVAEQMGRDPLDLAYDLLLGDGGKAFLYLPMLNYADGNLDAAGEMLTHPNTVVGLADGGAHVGTICDASFPTTLLAHWGRDRSHGRIELPLLVHRQTQATARTVGLLDRGVLAPGHRADVNLIDFDRLRARRPEMRGDLPAGGNRLIQRADGYVATVCGGEVTYQDGEATGQLPGRLVRGARPQPKGAAR